MSPFDRTVEAADSASIPSEFDSELSGDASPFLDILASGTLSKKAASVASSEVLDFAPIEGYKFEANPVNDETKEIVREDGKKLMVTRDKDGDLMSIVFASEKPEQSIRKSKDGKSWQCDPPNRADLKFVDVSVDAAGTIVVKLIDGGKKGFMTLHSNGKATGGFDPS